jgi:transcriptional regulator EpsA
MPQRDRPDSGVPSEPARDILGSVQPGASLNAMQVESIVRAAESALEVRRRYQFFVWSQSNLQVLLPHQLIICGAYIRQRRELQFEAFNNVAVPPEVLEGLTDARGPLMQQLQGRWIDQRCKPVLVSVGSLAGLSVEALQTALLAAGYRELLVHGVSRPQRPTELESFFLLARAGRIADKSAETPQRTMLELLMPHLHSTWLRVLAVERELNDLPRPAAARSSLNGPASGAGITERERQILSWLREGMSNQQIGEVLSISPLTVKNHVQKILRKLGAANRAQAVARAMSMNLLGRSPSEGGSKTP